MDSLSEPQTLILAEDNLLNEVDLRFLPSFSKFITEIPATHKYSAPVLLVIVSTNPQQLLPELQPWFSREDSSVLFLWNITQKPDIAHALSQSSEIVAKGSFHTFNHTGHLLVSDEITEKAPQLNKRSVQLLEEIRQHRISIPNEVFKQSLWRYSYLIKAYGDLAEKESKIEDDLHRLKTDLNKLKHENKKLEDDLSNQEIEFSKLQSKYSALSKSRLGSLTLKMWAKRRK